MKSNIRLLIYTIIIPPRLYSYVFKLEKKRTYKLNSKDEYIY